MDQEMGPKRLVMWNDKDGSGGPSNKFNGHSEVAEFQNPLCGSSSSYSNNRDGGSGVGLQRSEADHKRLSFTDIIPKELPIGLKLRKTSSFIELLEMKLSQGRSTNLQSSHVAVSRAKDEDREKLKASNFTASFLKIGDWERIAMYEGDLVVKCYYAKRKIVWEILEKGLKSKLEIQWLDIIGIRATIQENEPGYLQLELNQTPTFFREINPQPRKHTLWQMASDFTGGQALIHRRHVVHFPPGTLEKHYEKLLQCDSRLLELSRRPFPTLECPYFPENIYNCQNYPYHVNAHHLNFPGGIPFHHSNFPTPSPVQSHRIVQPVEQMSEPSFRMMQSTASPMLGMDFSALDESTRNHGFENQAAAYWNQVMNNKAGMVRGNQIESTIPFASPPQTYQAYHDQNNGIFGPIDNHFLSGTEVGCADERMLLPRVNSWISAANEEPRAAHRMEFGQDGFAADDESVLTVADHFNEGNGQFFLQQQQPNSWIPPPPPQVIDEILPMQIPRNNNSLFPYGFAAPTSEDFVPENNFDEVNNYWGRF